MIGIQDLATTILKEIDQILRYTFEVIYDLLEFIASFQIVDGLFRLIGDVLEFTIWKPMRYYWEYIGEPTFEVCNFDQYVICTYFLKILYIPRGRSILY
jgi:hypothetical protein